MFEEVTLLKLVVAKSKGIVKLYIRSTHIIPARDKSLMEREIRDQMFKDTGFIVKILEDYVLPDTYTPTTLLNEYWESMLYELSENAKILENAFKKMRFEAVDDTTVKVILPDRAILKDREGKILEYLNLVVCERCKLEASFKFDPGTAFEYNSMGRIQDHKACGRAY